MTIQEITKYLDKKIKENENEIRITFFDVRVKHNLSESETDTFLTLCKNRLENLGYNVFFAGAKFTYKNIRRIVQSNELMIAVKEI